MLERNEMEQGCTHRRDEGNCYTLKESLFFFLHQGWISLTQFHGLDVKGRRQLETALSFHTDEYFIAAISV